MCTMISISYVVQGCAVPISPAEPIVVVVGVKTVVIALTLFWRSLSNTFDEGVATSQRVTLRFY